MTKKKEVWHKNVHITRLMEGFVFLIGLVVCSLILFGGLFVMDQALKREPLLLAVAIAITFAYIVGCVITEVK